MYADELKVLKLSSSPKVYHQNYRIEEAGDVLIQSFYARSAVSQGKMYCCSLLIQQVFLPGSCGCNVALSQTHSGT